MGFWEVQEITTLSRDSFNATDGRAVTMFGNLGCVAGTEAADLEI